MLTVHFTLGTLYNIYSVYSLQNTLHYSVHFKTDHQGKVDKLSGRETGLISTLDWSKTGQTVETRLQKPSQAFPY